MEVSTIRLNVPAKGRYQRAALRGNPIDNNTLERLCVVCLGAGRALGQLMEGGSATRCSGHGKVVVPYLPCNEPPPRKPSGCESQGQERAIRAPRRCGACVALCTTQLRIDTNILSGIWELTDLSSPRRR